MDFEIMFEHFDIQELPHFLTEILPRKEDNLRAPGVCTLRVSKLQKYTQLTVSMLSVSAFDFGFRLFTVSVTHFKFNFINNLVIESADFR